MSLSPGARLGSYEITGAIGAGGMGEVYRARDTKLNRDVAIKVLPELFAADPERLARFTREAQTLAALSHSNIAHVYGVVDQALVMEFADGEDLSAIIARGPMPLADALPIARQIADALETAHEHGIVHRDLKPANVKIGPDGAVKVLDFGLAKAMGPDAGPSQGDALNSPTFTAHATRLGVIIGTAAYMAPEQARGKAVDKRADIWAFGVVLFEMLTGRRAFDGDDMSDVLAAVLRQDIPWNRLPGDTPPRLRRLLERCLERDVKQRLRDIGEARVEIAKIERGDPDSSGPAAPIAADRRGGIRWARVAPWIVAASAIVIAIADGITARRLASAVVLSVEATIAPPEGRDFRIGSNSGNVSISPDGTTVAFVAAATDGSNEPVLWVRPIARNEPRALPGTKGIHYPFWSPDSRTVAFFAERKLRTIEISGGLPQAVADVEQGRGGCWGEDGRILFTPKGGGTVFSVAATGGPVTPVTRLNAAHAENANYWPTCLPGAKRFLYFARSKVPEFNGIYLANTDGTGEPVKVVSSLSSALFVPSGSGGPGYLVWARDTDLLAQPFDAESGRLSGEAVRITTDVLVDESQRGLMAAASRTGTLLWASARGEQLQFAWYDRAGRRVATIPIEAGHVYVPSVAPDGRSLLFYRAEKGGADVWQHTFADGLSRRLTNEPGYNQSGAWLPDGRGIVYVADAGMKRIALDRSTAAETLVSNEDLDAPTVTPDGRFAITAMATAGRPGRTLWAIALAAPHAATQLSTDPGEASNCLISPDGRWLMWLNADGVRDEILLSPLGVQDGKPRLGTQRIPVGSGEPIGWRADGRELFYLQRGRQVMAVPVAQQGETVSLGSPITLFTIPAVPKQLNAVAVNADGSRFVVTEAPFAEGQALHLLTNWPARLPDRRP